MLRNTVCNFRSSEEKEKKNWNEIVYFYEVNSKVDMWCDCTVLFWYDFLNILLWNARNIRGEGERCERALMLRKRKKGRRKPLSLFLIQFLGFGLLINWNVFMRGVLRSSEM